jgi:hypothetical protein
VALGRLVLSNYHGQPNDLVDWAIILAVAFYLVAVVPKFSSRPTNYPQRATPDRGNAIKVLS